MFQTLLRHAPLAALIIQSFPACTLARKSLIIDTDLFSDVDDAGALLLAATSSDVDLLAVNINYPSSYSAVCASGMLAHYGLDDVPIGIRRPVTNESFFDTYSYELGEYASKIAYHYSGGSVQWGQAEDARDPVELYREILSAADDGSVTIASIGFFENLSGLLNSTADSYSNLSGPALIERKVSELVVMGGGYPSGREYNFFGDSPLLTAHVVNNWPRAGRVVFSGTELGGNVSSGAALLRDGPRDDPVRLAYLYYTHGEARYSWDPLTVLYAIDGLAAAGGEEGAALFEYANADGYNYVYPNGSNVWIADADITTQHYLRLRVENVTAAAALDARFLSGAWSAVEGNGTSATR